MEQVLIFATVLLPIVAALVDLVKKSINLPKNLIPLISLVVGLFIGAIAYPFTDFELILRFQLQK